MSAPPANPALRGTLAALACYVMWGVVPLYWRHLAAVDATELIAHRLVWSLVLLLGIQALRGRLRAVVADLADPRQRWRSLASGSLLTANWWIYVWGVHHGHVIECSLGYFLVPLINAALGRLVLGETLRPWQVVAIGLAAAGVGWLVAQVGHVPWIALGLAFTFGFYGLLKKRSALGPLGGLTAEALVLAPVAITFLLVRSNAGTSALVQGDPTLVAWVLSTGVVTTIPLLLFAYGARRLRLTALGLLQYAAPTGQFLIGWLVFDEPFSADRAWAFVVIWAGLACYTFDGLREARVSSRERRTG